MDDGLEMEDGLLQRFKDWFKESSNDSSEWREDAEEDFNFPAGHQWDENDIKALKDANRPVVTFNRVGTIIDAVSGMEVNNRQEIRYIPRRVGSAGVNDTLTGAVNWLRDQGNAEDEESDAFRDLAICGMGWTDTRLNYEDQQDGTTEDERVDPLEMYWDTKNKKKNLQGGRFVMRLKTDVCLDDARAMFPEALDEDLDASWITAKGSLKTEKKDANDRYALGESQEKTNGDDKINLLEVQWWDRETYYKVQDPDTMEIKEFNKEEFELISERIAETGGLPLQSVKLTRKVYKQAFVGNVILEQNPCPAKNRFTLQCMTGKRDQKSNTYYGIVRAMKDPQRWANKWLSQVMHIINSNSKGGLLAETGAFENARKAKAEWADPTTITLLKEGGLSKILEKKPITYPSGLDQLMQFAIASIRDVSGVNMEIIGATDREQSGVLEVQRKKAAMTVLASMFDSLRLFRKEKGHIYLEYVQNYLSDGRLVKIAGKDGAQFIPLVRDTEVTDYEVVIDEAPASPNQKDQVWAFMIQMLPVVGKMMTPQIWAEIIPYSPLPESLTQKLGKMITDAANTPNPQAQETAALAKETAIASIEVLKADAQKSLATAELNRTKAKVEKVEAFGNLTEKALKGMKG